MIPHSRPSIANCKLKIKAQFDVSVPRDVLCLTIVTLFERQSLVDVLKGVDLFRQHTQPLHGEPQQLVRYGSKGIPQVKSYEV